MVQRKDSLCYMEFVRGKYDLNNIDFVIELLSNMTDYERRYLVRDHFDILWNRVWCQPTIQKHSLEFAESKKKFELLRSGFFNDNQQFINLEKLVAAAESRYFEPEWGFPKGRRRLRESDLDCAIREFCEETGCVKDDITIMHPTPYVENFYGTNHQPYCHAYYIARFSDTPRREAHVDHSNIHQIREVGQIGWFTYKEVIERIRSYNWERQKLFKVAHQHVCNLQKNPSSPSPSPCVTPSSGTESGDSSATSSKSSSPRRNPSRWSAVAAALQQSQQQQQPSQHAQHAQHVQDMQTSYQQQLAAAQQQLQNMQLQQMQLQQMQAMQQYMPIMQPVQGIQMQMVPIAVSVPVAVPVPRMVGVPIPIPSYKNNSARSSSQ